MIVIFNVPIGYLVLKLIGFELNIQRVFKKFMEKI